MVQGEHCHVSKDRIECRGERKLDQPIDGAAGWRVRWRNVRTMVTM
jgi:hypothetical protein